MDDEEGTRQQHGPMALEAYEALAESYAAEVDDKPHNAFYERPAMLAMFPAGGLEGQRVLDAGCGPGNYSEALLQRGAEVVALDVSPKMVEIAQRRLDQRATVLQLDLGQAPLEPLEAGSFDGILCALALHYLLDLGLVFEEFARLLRPGGWLLFSTSHPFGDYLRHADGSYFETERIEDIWAGFGEPTLVPSYRRPLQATLGPLLTAGFALEELVEPRPTGRFWESDPAEAMELDRRPGFLCVRARWPGPGHRG